MNEVLQEQVPLSNGVSNVNQGTNFSKIDDVTPKKRPDCPSPIIKMTWTTTGDYTSVQPISRNTRNPMKPATVKYYSTSSSSGSSSSSSSNSSSGSFLNCGNSGTAKKCNCSRMCCDSTPKWFIRTPLVQHLKKTNSRNELVLESDLKSMHLSQIYPPQQKHHTQTLNSLKIHQGTDSHGTPEKVAEIKRPCNPFEIDLINTMHMSSFSPSVFSKVVTPSKEEQQDGFNWGMDNFAVLYSKEFDTPAKQNSTPKCDQEMEDKIQCAINTFFAQSVWVPSPLVENGSKFVQCSIQPSDHSKDLVDSCSNFTISSDTNTDKNQRDAWCQTVFTLPPNFDLHEIMKNFFTFTNNQANDESHSDVKETDVKEMLSSSSLRRKLFANDEIALSEGNGLNSVDVLDHLDKTPQKQSFRRSPTSTSFEHFASSPVITIDNHSQRASLTPPSSVESPVLSPIKMLRCTTSATTNVDEECERMMAVFPLHSELAMGFTYQSSNETKKCTYLTGEASENVNRVLDEEMETWIDSTSATAASKTSFMETTDDNYIPLPLQHLVSNQDTGYDTNTGGTLSLMSSQDLTSFSTSIQAPQQNLQKPVVGLKVSFKVPPTFCFPNKDYITMSEPATLLERESMKMGVCADTVPISNNLKEAPKTEWTPLVSSTPSREQY